MKDQAQRQDTEDLNKSGMDNPGETARAAIWAQGLTKDYERGESLVHALCGVELRFEQGKSQPLWVLPGQASPPSCTLWQD